MSRHTPRRVWHNLPEMNRQRVVRIDQSPMNERIWVLQLACGCDHYVTQKRRPSLQRTWTDNATGERMCGPRMIDCNKCQPVHGKLK